MRLCWDGFFVSGFCYLICLTTGSAGEFEIDCAKPIGTIRPLHGGNCGPLQYGGVLDFSKQFKELGAPLIRLHDCHWPNPDVVDIHTVFPDADADPSLPENYDFRRTDAYIDGIVKTGSGLVYRLGESIEHTPERRHVHPPKDPEKWAASCVGIIRHYNEGWARGFNHDIRYWEIWNEPENRPAMWSGTDEQYFKLYGATAKAIKARWPDLKVGGPSLGYTGKITEGRFEPGEFLTKFLAHCRDHELPLDFFSWHLYTSDPSECVVRAKGIRAELGKHGFEKTELHLNEWNFLPESDWAPMMAAAQGRQRADWFKRIHDAEGAAFTASVLTNLQDSPVDVANYYSFTHHGFGVFNTEGVAHKPFYSLLAFRRLLECPHRVAVTTTAEFTALAGLNLEKTELRVLLGNTGCQDRSIKLTTANLPWQGPTRYEVAVVDANKNLVIASSGSWDRTLELGEVLAAPSVGLLRLWPVVQE
ncbi:MAG: xylan 1,4-beta-xylosidase [Verrucomicrobiales bacterium]